MQKLGAAMKVVMINDCAFVGETLLKYLPTDVEKRHIKRTRSLWSKTFGIAYSILGAKADIYHVHYLLQDCYIAARMGKKPLVGHAMGSDLRQQLKSRKWGWIVRSNLKNCNKILVCQPTILDAAKEYNETAEYLPIPFDPKIFYPKPLHKDREQKHVLLASAHDFAIKGTDKLLKAVASMSKMPIKVKTISFGRDVESARQLARELGIKIEFIPKVPHEKMNELYWESDLVLGSFGVGQLDTVAIEAMACGRPAVHSIYKEYFSDCPLERLETTEQVSRVISKLLFDEREIKQRVKGQLEYVNATHSAFILAKRLMKIYDTMVSNETSKN
jgi:glycosyltransferase involved in cell wall biosynthesis